MEKETEQNEGIKVQISIQVPAEVREKLDAEAKRQNRSRNMVINRILAEKLAEVQK